MGQHATMPLGDDRTHESHRVHPLVDRTDTLGNYAAALKDLAAGNFTGKLVMSL